MKSYIKQIIFASLFIMIGMLFWGGRVQASRSLGIKHYDITATIQENGDVAFVEDITFKASGGSYNGVFYHLDIANIEEPTDISVKLMNQDGEETLSASSAAADYYSLTRNNNQLEFKVYHHFNDTARVKFYYTIPHMITNYQDTAEFNRKVVGGEWDMIQEDVQVHINLPGRADRESLRAWGHGGTAKGQVTIRSDYSGVDFMVLKNPSKQFVEAHVVFPNTLTPMNTNQKAENAFDRIVATEERIVEKDKKDAKRHRILQWASMILVGLNVLAVAFFGWYKRKQYYKQVPLVPDHLYEIPMDLSPAVMAQLFFKVASIGNQLSATIMDLVRKKALTLEADQQDQNNFVLTKVAFNRPLRKHESFLLDFYFEEISSDGSHLSLKEIKKYVQTHTETYAQKEIEWLNLVKAEAKQYDFYLAPSDKTFLLGKIFTALLPLTLILATSLAFSYGIAGTFFSGIFGLLPIVIFFFIISLVKHSGGQTFNLNGEYERRRWMAFKKMLEDISNIHLAEVPSIVIWDEILVYAIALNVADKVIQVLGKYLPDHVMQESVFYREDTGWAMYSYYHALNHHVVSSSNQSLVQSFKGHSGSNSGGFGGGFSSGSSGGFGGGSGGGGF